MVEHSSLFIEALLLDKKAVKKLTKHYFLERKTTPKEPSIDALAKEWGIDLLESFAYVMLYRAFFRYGSPITLAKLCKTLQMEKKKFPMQLRLMLYLRFAEKQGLITKKNWLKRKISKTEYVIKHYDVEKQQRKI
ncbi:hypothetical protein [Sulfurospirillum sp. UCH001]|uniref:hypothetical protein n=1 Tax=Sulfurospirillum sp. UCH001 TaxID=1581011 RepID=UPI00082DF1C0|nr:hypothetical protein [Sulfurospirillum sp. UCH001]